MSELTKWTDVNAAVIDGLLKLREPFPEHQISKLPKPTIAAEDYKKLSKGKCSVCGGYHATTNTIHLDYVGHAALTDRLLDADPFWSWEPVAWDEQGLPRFDKTGGLWIKLTVCGHTRLGYGNAEGKSWSDVGSREKEVIGDALRNAAMRFGAALDLWHKGELHVEDDEKKPPSPDVRQNSHKILPSTEAVESIVGGPREPSLRLVAEKITDHMAEGDVVNAASIYMSPENMKPPEEKIFVWSLLSAEDKKALKAYLDANKPQSVNAAQKAQALRDAVAK